jgi:hypothetical protein
MGNRLNIIIILLLLISPISFGSEEYFKRTLIPTGTKEEQVTIYPYDDADDIFSMKGFFIDERGCLYFQEDVSGKIKVFTESGNYLRTLRDYNCQYLFLHDKHFIGQRRSTDKTEELIFFSRDNGVILSQHQIALGGGKWIAYKIKDEMVLFYNLEKGPRGEKKAFDIKEKCFTSQGIYEWDNKTEEQIYSPNIEYGAEPIGKLNGYYLFWFPPPPKDMSFEYALRAAKVEDDNIIFIQAILKKQDVGSAMQGLIGGLIDNKYLFTIGYPEPHRGKQPEVIWVTRIDLKELMPDLWKPRPVDREIVKMPINGHM